MLNGSQRRQRPAIPSSCSQQLTTRNGGSTNVATAAASSAFCQRDSRPVIHSAATNPSVTDNTLVSALTSRLFCSRTQFISTQEDVLERRRGCIQIAQQAVPIRFQGRDRQAGGRDAFQGVRDDELFRDFHALQIIEQLFGGGGMGPRTTATVLRMIKVPRSGQLGNRQPVAPAGRDIV